MFFYRQYQANAISKNSGQNIAYILFNFPESYVDIIEMNRRVHTCRMGERDTGDPEGQTVL